MAQFAILRISRRAYRSHKVTVRRLAGEELTSADENLSAFDQKEPQGSSIKRKSRRMRPIYMRPTPPRDHTHAIIAVARWGIHHRFTACKRLFPAAGRRPPE
jgi:hypothetical protein